MPRVLFLGLGKLTVNSAIMGFLPQHSLGFSLETNSRHVRGQTSGQCLELWEDAVLMSREPACAGETPGLHGASALCAGLRSWIMCFKKVAFSVYFCISLLGIFRQPRRPFVLFFSLSSVLKALKFVEIILTLCINYLCITVTKILARNDGGRAYLGSWCQKLQVIIVRRTGKAAQCW